MSVQRAIMILGTDGQPHPIRILEDTLVCTTYPLSKQVAEGAIPGSGSFQVAGYLPSISSSRQQIWPLGGSLVFPPDDGTTCLLVSSSDQDKHPDNGGGTGCHVVRVYCLLAVTAASKVSHAAFFAENFPLGYPEHGALWIQEVKTNGTTPVTLADDSGNPIPLYRNNGLRAVEMNTPLTNVSGNITLYKSGDTSKKYSYILASRNRSQNGFWTVPAGKHAFLEGWSVSVSHELYGYAEFNISTTYDAYDRHTTPGVFSFVDLFPVLAGTTPAPRRFETPVYCPALTDIRTAVQGQSMRNTSVSTAAYVTFQGYYEDEYDE